MLGRPFIVVCALLPLLAGPAAQAQTPDDATVPPARLKSSPLLEPPPLKTTTPGKPPATGAGAPAAESSEAAAEAIFLRADRLEGDLAKWIEASGNAELRTRRQTVIADWLRYDVDSQEFWGKGNVTLRRGIDWVTGPEVKFKRDSETGFFTGPQFHIGENASRGDAKEIVFAGPNREELKDVRYTTCVAGNDDWYLTARDVDLDRSRQVGIAHDATVLFKGSPILYSPYLDFPLSNERKSGFLTPVFGSTSSRGIEMSLPYYFNLAPNYDATLTPRLMTRRGLQLNGQARYLFTDAAGEADVEFLPDRITNTNRYGLAWKHGQNFSFLPGLGGYVNLQRVSDDTYFTDLSDRLVVTSQTNLPREGGLAYNRGPFSALLRVQSFQTLQDPNNPILPPYFREPQLLATLNPVEWHSFDVAATSEFVRFRQPALTDGDRANIYPTIAWSKQGNYWFFTAKTGINATAYNLETPSADGTTHLNRVLPISSVDAGLVFERDTTFLDKSFVQTLEPRAYYVYIPYRNQSQIPAFDTAIDDFNFSQLFTENRYLGIDRIGDANQVTLAVTSRFLESASGDERMRFSIGQRYYFQDQRVTLSEPPRTSKTSDLLLAGEGRFSDAWAASGDLQYNFRSPHTDRLDLGVRWQPGAGKVINASYRYIRQDIDSTGAITQLKQVDLSGQWPFLDNWSFIGRWNYSLVDAKTLEGVIGFEYNGGCWAFRIVGQRLTTATEQASKSVFVQFELNGLARLGTNPIDVLRRSVAGYKTVNDPTLQPSVVNPSDYFPGF
jgi:LPS-assembly protein